MCLYFRVRVSFILLVLLLVSLKERYPVIHTDEETEAERQRLQRDLLLDLDY